MNLKRISVLICWILIVFGLHAQTGTGEIDSIAAQSGVPVEIKIVPANLSGLFFIIQPEAGVALKILKISTPSRQLWFKKVGSEAELQSTPSGDAILFFSRGNEVLVKLPARVKTEPEISILVAPQIISKKAKNTFLIKLLNGQVAQNSRSVREFKVKISK